MYTKEKCFFFLHNSPIVIDFNKTISIKSIRNVTLWYVITYVIFIISRFAMSLLIRFLKKIYLFIYFYILTSMLFMYDLKWVDWY